VERIEVLQTHISVLFFAGDRVYKLKKPVALDFLDYTDVDERRRYCEEEVRLNRRISPSMYLGVVPVTRAEARQDEGEPGLRVGGDGEPVDWVVEMVRLPADRMLDALLARHAVAPEQLLRVAIVLARFHDRAMTGPEVNRHALPSAIRTAVDENVDQLADTVAADPGSFPPEGLAFLRRRMRAFLDEHPELLARRIADWRIREGHGDLHAGNVCLVEDDALVYDCVEFDRTLRCGDVASDLAFLAMDMDHRGSPEVSRRLVELYAEISSDPDLARLVAFYRIHRALIRAKVELVTAGSEDLETEEREAAAGRARRYLQLALGYEAPQALVLLCGLPATGKSVLAAYVAGRLRARLIRSDVLRHEVLDGAGGTARGGGSRAHGAGDYAPDRRERVYREILRRAAAALRDGDSVVVDASFAREAFRRPFVDLAARVEVPLLLVCLRVPDSVALGRIARRKDVPDEPSEAGVQAFLGERERFEPPRELAGAEVLERSGSEPPEAAAAAVMARLTYDRGGSGAQEPVFERPSP